MSALPKHFFTPEEYLELEVKAEYKSQYVAGEIFAMAGTEPWHNEVLTSIVAALFARFRNRPCKVYATDIRLRVKAGDLYTYPDVMALCGKPEFETSQRPGSLLNPQVIFEVLSPSTEAFDRGDKFARYRRLDSLTNYVLVSADRMRVEQPIRLPSGAWAFEEHDLPAHVLRLASLDCNMPLAEIYERVTFPSPGAGG